MSNVAPGVADAPASAPKTRRPFPKKAILTSLAVMAGLALSIFLFTSFPGVTIMVVGSIAGLAGLYWVVRHLEETWRLVKTNLLLVPVVAVFVVGLVVLYPMNQNHSPSLVVGVFLWILILALTALPAVFSTPEA